MYKVEETITKNNHTTKISAGLHIAEGIEGAFGSVIREVSRLAVELTNQEEGTLIFGPLDPPNW
jgi:hypothetical protein